jgi:hypothetical protein|tara:strand:- start:166 stop:348 length:183 start_codon:yes stop_codon:yes gene_type:complete
MKNITIPLIFMMIVMPIGMITIVEINENSRIDPVVPTEEPPMEGWPKDSELTIFVPDNRI